jgi:aromatic ring-opening dioxygenase catalytic subunit (LigB family)
LRDEGVLIIGSGSSYHNLREFFGGRGAEASLAFDDWLNETVTTQDPAMRNARLTEWAQAPGGRACHPREDHLIPLMVAAGAGGTDPGRRTFRDLLGGKAVSCFSFG